MAEQNVLKMKRKMEENYGTMLLKLYQECALAHARFSALYTVIEDAGLEEDYQAWKKKNIQKEGTEG